MRQSENLLERQADTIERVLGQLGISARVVGGTDTQRITAFELQAAWSDRLGGAGNIIAQALGAQEVRLYPKNGTVVVAEAVKGEPRLLRIDGLYAQTGQLPPMTAIIGRSQRGEPLVIDMIKSGHLLATGDSGAGKTALIRAIVAGLCLSMPVKQMNVCLLDPRLRAMGALARLPHAGTAIMEHDEIHNALLVLANIVNRRLRTREQLPAHIVVIDELGELEEKSAALVGHLLESGGRVGVHVVAGATNACAWSGRFPLVAAGAAQDGGPAGSEAHRLEGRGDFVLSTKAGWERFEAAWLGANELKKVMQKIGGK